MKGPHRSEHRRGRAVVTWAGAALLSAVLASCDGGPAIPAAAPPGAGATGAGGATGDEGPAVSRPGDYDTGNGIVVTVPQTTSYAHQASLGVNTAMWSTQADAAMCGFTVVDSAGHTWARVTSGLVQCNDADAHTDGLPETDETRAMFDSVVAVMHDQGWQDAGAGTEAFWYSVAFER